MATRFVPAVVSQRWSARNGAGVHRRVRGRRHAAGVGVHDLFGLVGIVTDGNIQHARAHLRTE